MVRAFILSLRQLGDRRVLAILARSLALTLVLLVGIIAVLAVAARSVAAYWSESATFANILAVAVAMAALLGAWLLFRVVAIAVIGIFADDVTEVVEARYYPARFASARALSPVGSARMALLSAARAIVINLALSPIYLMLIATGIGTAFLFLVVNAWLLGRDLGDMVAVRHLDRAEVRAWRGRTRISRFVLGLAVAALLLIPFVNLLAPLLGTAMATHLFHDEDAI